MAGTGTGAGTGAGRLEGATCLVTGAAQGFGLGIAERFAAEGATVALLDLQADKAAEVAETIGHGAFALSCDVADPASVAAAVDEAASRMGSARILVNNAGWSHRNMPALDVTEAEFDKVFAVNVKSIWNFSQAIVPRWRAAGGGVMLNIGSTAGIRPRPGLSWYNATKGAVNLLSRSLAVEFASDNIRVNCIAPVAGETPLLATFMGEDTPEKRAAFKATVPLGRLSTPRDVANAALYLCSDEADFITGVVLEVDGGRTI
ncbi:3-oxoacyl-[acyl-carrier protein] reductase [Albimonas donghaensis]|uniref:3-oxoacyl-[acyl-carrier protein] reductase n=1 Tax=Albimonas donghaensis TaxID=356660 RepID=A0A1H3AU25_9RHOB|nr:glucose 1-dehydrogenase [Albimonas donghaensis]SDX32928.1 3-oxoacyl-[acyl-carrier protein] reductase [Albimonas donghaensis]